MRRNIATGRHLDEITLTAYILQPIRWHLMKQANRGSSHGLEVNLDFDEENVKVTGKVS